MIVTCPRCLTKFNLPDENLESDFKLNLRCSRCLEEFPCPVKEEVLPPSDGATAASAGAGLVSGFVPGADEVGRKTQNDDVALELNIDELCSADYNDQIAGAGDQTAAGESGPERAEIDSDSSFVLLEEERLSGSRESAADNDGEKVVPAGSGSSRSLIAVLAALIILGLSLWGGYGLWRNSTVDMSKALRIIEVSNQRLVLPSKKVVLVMKGAIVNNSGKTVVDLKVMGVLIDGDGRVVARAPGLGGINLAPPDIEFLDSKKLAALEKRVCNLQPHGGRQFFTVIFNDCPENARNCYAEISSFRVQ